MPILHYTLQSAESSLYHLVLGTKVGQTDVYITRVSNQRSIESLEELLRPGRISTYLEYDILLLSLMHVSNSNPLITGREREKKTHLHTSSAVTPFSLSLFLFCFPPVPKKRRPRPPIEKFQLKPDRYIDKAYILYRLRLKSPHEHEGTTFPLQTRSRDLD